MAYYIVPRGTEIRLDTLTTESVVIVDGTLQVAGLLRAGIIQGCGSVEAVEIQYRNMKVDTVSARLATGRRIAAKKLFIQDCRASESIVSTEFIEADYVFTPSLTMALSNVKECQADKVTILRARRRGAVRMLLAAWLRNLWACIRHPGGKETEEDEELEEEEFEAEAMEQSPSCLPAGGTFLIETDGSGNVRKISAVPNGEAA